MSSYFKGTFGVMSDNHLRDSQWGLSSRSSAFFNSVMGGIDIAFKRGVRTIINGGDIAQSNRPGPDTVLQIIKLNRRLRDLGMCMLIVSGNHDATPRSHWLEVVVGDVEANKREALGIIYLSNTRYQVPDGPLVLGISPIEQNSGKAGFLLNAMGAEPADVLLWHGPVQEFQGIKNENNLSIAEIPVDKFRCVVIGDTHRHMVLFQPDHPSIPVISPGSTEVHTIDEIEDCPDKFITFVTLGQGVYSIDKEKLPSSPCRVFKILGPDDIDDNIVKLREHADNCPDNSIILVRHVPDVRDDKIRTLVMTACAAASVRGVCVRIAVIPMRKDDPSYSVEVGDAEVMPDILDFLKHTEHANPVVNQIRRGMLTPGVQWEAALDTLLEDVIAGKSSSVA